MSISSHGKGHACQAPHCFLLSGHLSVGSQPQCPANTQSRQKNSDAVFQRRRNKNLWTWLPRGLQIVLESRVRLGSLGSHSAWLLSEGFSAVAFSMAVFHSPQPVYLGHLEVCKKERPLSSPFIRQCLWCRCTCGHFCGVFSVGSSVLCFVANTVKQLYLGYVCERKKIAKLFQCPWQWTAVYWSSLCVLYWTHIIICTYNNPCMSVCFLHVTRFNFHSRTCLSSAGFVCENTPFKGSDGGPQSAGRQSLVLNQKPSFSLWPAGPFSFIH